MTDIPEMPEMVPHKDTGRFNGREHHIYRDGFTAGVLAERSRDPADAAAIRRAVLSEAEKAARGGDHSECDHGEGYTDGRLDAAAAIAALAERPPAQAVDAAAIRRAALAEAATIIRNYAVKEEGHEDGSIASLMEAERRIHALALSTDDPPAQPVDDGWRSDMEAAPKNGARFLFTNGKDVVGTGRFFQGAHFAADSWQGSNYTVVTHWQPLPNLPAPPAPERET